MLLASRLKQLHQVPGTISQKNLRAAGSGHDVVAELRAGGTQSCDLAWKIIHNKMDAVPAASRGERHQAWAARLNLLRRFAELRRKAAARTDPGLLSPPAGRGMLVQPQQAATRM